MKYTILTISASLCLTCLPSPGAEPPLDLGTGNVNASGINYASAAVTHPDGTLESFFRKSGGGKVSIFSIRSTDDGHTWSEPAPLVDLSVERWGGPIPLLDRDGELHFVIPKARGEGRKAAIDRFIDLYHLRSEAHGTRWTRPKRIYEGYCGSIQCLVQLSSGRIIAPFGDSQPGVPAAPPTGPSVTTVVYSDDGGETWHRSPAALTAPCFEGYNGGNYGACEPTVIELEDGRAWMLIRTQTGMLYESFSEDGIAWSNARPSRFPSSNSPAFPIRLSKGRIVLFWNNCVNPLRLGGKDGVYAGRDALHAAISSDEGKSWRGFREIYRDPTRNGTPPAHGDRGTAYPHATLAADGRILLVSGQGTDRRRRFLVDPKWLLEKDVTEDFAAVDEWHLFKGFGPAKRAWRDRVAGPEIVAHPDEPGAKVLHLRRPDDRDADGATWNFPTGRSGTLFLHLRIEKDFGGAQVSLTDRFYNPCDDQGEALSPLQVRIDPDGNIAGTHMQLDPGTWHDLQLSWSDIDDEKAASASIAHIGEPAVALPLKYTAVNGLSYLRLRSLATEVDPAGILVSAVHVRVE